MARPAHSLVRRLRRRPVPEARRRRRLRADPCPEPIPALEALAGGLLRVGDGPSTRRRRADCGGAAAA